MTQLSELLAAGQRFHAEHCPATIRISGQSYAAATTGRTTDRDLGEGGFVLVHRIAFQLPRADFDAAGQPEPQRGAVVDCLAPAALAASYALDLVRSDPAGVNLHLVCTAPVQ